MCFLSALGLKSQGWTLRLQSSVEKDGKGLSGASIKLYQGAKIVSQSVSGGDGDFDVEIPPNGDFMLVVSYGDCNTKKFQVSTLGVPEEISNERFRPSFEIGGVTMAKPLYSIDYSVLQQPLVKIGFQPRSKKFDHDENHTEQMLQALGRIREAEKALIQKQKESCDAGDAALKKNDCDLAKQNYDKAVALIPQLPYETYPKQQLAKVDQCFKAKEAEAKKQNDEIAAKAAAEKTAADKAAADKAAKEKAEADKLVKEKQGADKAAADKLLAEQAAAAKIAADATAKERANTEKLAKEKADKEKAEADKLAKEKELTTKASSDKAAKEKLESDRLAKEKLESEKAAAAKLAADKLAKEKADSDKRAKDKAAKEKVEADKMAEKKKEEEKVKEEKPKVEKVSEPVAVQEKKTEEKQNDTKITPKTSDKEPEKKSKKKKAEKSKYSIRPRL